ncbi:Cytochrome b5-like heme/steroid binding domain-containing protein [Dioscorea alata]|uniref:Cytochrome b5-like heme/steroid binding domain-containing protein n=1 Tax=Dioscorea alata TaxID=55571 RepID=A0ACB7W0S9_DIOAL|nr:Cytochrome b5-like heme/steroid binding domain-containing protein [Dioscorea alata]
MQISNKYSHSEISLHTSKKDCWLVIHGKVYDVTTFLEDHPGGEDVLLHASASGDATQSFEDVGHSSAATSLMEGYLIGAVEGYNGGSSGAPKAGEGGAMRARAIQERGPPSSNFLDYILPLFILAVAFGAWYYLTHYAHDKAN